MRIKDSTIRMNKEQKARMNQEGLHTAEEGKRGKKDHASQKAIKAKQREQRAYSGGVIKKTRGTGAALRGLNYNSGGKSERFLEQKNGFHRR